MYDLFTFLNLKQLTFKANFLHNFIIVLFEEPEQLK